MAGAVAVCLLAGGFLQLIPLPDGGPAKAGAAVTPAPETTQPTGGRVPPVTIGSSGGGGEHGHEEGGGVGRCWLWGTNYVGVAYKFGPDPGAWSVTASGNVYAGPSDVPTYGTLSTVGGQEDCSNGPIVGITASFGANGYWLATSTGGVFAFGSARYTSHDAGEPGHASPIVAITSEDWSTTGYWVVDSRGQVYAYGGAAYYGGTPSLSDGNSVVAMASARTGSGYYLLTSYGNVFAYGSAASAMGGFTNFRAPGLGSNPYDSYVGIGSAPTGFWMVRMEGTIYAYTGQGFTNPRLNPSNDYIVSLTVSTQWGGIVMMNKSGQFYVRGNATDPGNDPFVGPVTQPPAGKASGSPGNQTGGGKNPSNNKPSYCKGDPVDCESGDLWETDTDVTVPGLGQHLDLSRTYNSESAATRGIFGYGWSSSYTMSVAVKPSTWTTVTETNGSTVTFYTDTTGYFVAPQGTLATLDRKATGGYTFVLRNTATYTFNADGWLVAEKDLNDYTTTLAYNGGGQLTTVTDPSGRTITFAYNATGLVSSVTNPAGQVTSYGYGTKNLTSVTDPAGRVTRYTYDATHRMVTETSPTGGVTTTTYGTRGKVVRQVDPTGLATTWTYAGTNATIGVTTITGPEGSVTKETFFFGELRTKTTAYGTPSAATWHYTYTPTTFGVTSVRDPAGNTTTTTYNATGDVTSVTEPTGDKTTTTYNQYNEPLVTVDPMGITTTDTYDAYGNLTQKVVKADSSCTSSCTQITTYTYGNTTRPGEVTETSDPMGHQTTYTYDAYGDVVSTAVSTIGTTQQDVYNVLGEKVCRVSLDAYAQGTRCPTAGNPRVAVTTTWTYDADGEVVATANALTQTTTTAYEVSHGSGDCTASVGGAAYCTVTTGPTGDVGVTYDDQDGRTVGTETGTGSPTSTTSTTAYDVAVGQGTCVTGVATATNCQVTTNGNGQETTDYLNAITEVIKVVAPGNEVTTTTYDKTGNVATTTTAAGTTTDSYDKDNRLTSVAYSNTASGYTKPANVTYTYNADGQKTKMVDGSGTTTYAYDGFDRLKSTNDGARKTVFYGYNATGEVTTLGYPDAKTVHRTYDALGRMTSTTKLTWLTTNTIDFSYQNSAPGVPGGSEMITRLPTGETETTVDNALGQQLTATVSPDPRTVPVWSTSTISSGWTQGVSMYGMSCPSVNFCAAAAREWRATTPTKGLMTSTDPSGGASQWHMTTLGVTTTVISCPSMTFCAAVSTTNNLFTSSNPTGGPSAWTKSTLPTEGFLVAMSCPSATFCVAVTETGYILTSSHPAGGSSAWTSTKMSPQVEFSALDCPTSTLCLAGTVTGTLFVSADPGGGSSTWKAASAGGVLGRLRGLPIRAVDCSVRWCIALTATEFGLNGTYSTDKISRVYVAKKLENKPTEKWTAHKFPGGTPQTVSCVTTTTFCAAGGTNGTISFTTNPAASSGGTGRYSNIATWSENQIAATATVTAISCPSATMCVAGASGDSPATGLYSGVLSMAMTRKATSFSYSDTYTQNGLVASGTETYDGVTVKQTYGYDANNQVTSSTATGATGGTGTYTYDAGGNPTSMVESSTQMTQSFNTAGQVTSAKNPLSTATTYTYNSLGARLTKHVPTGTETTYAYNQAGELVKAGGTEYTFNGDGLLMNVSTSSSGKTTDELTWDTQSTTPELVAMGAHSTTIFLYGPNGEVIGEDTATYNIRPTYFVHDALGSIVAKVNNTEQVSSYDYSAYGSLISGTSSSPIGFAGAAVMSNGLLYMGHRFYTPDTGEFLSVDPAVAMTGEPYEYATDDPVNNSDPTGLDTAGICAGASLTLYGFSLSAGECLTQTVDTTGRSQIGITKAAGFGAGIGMIGASASVFYQYTNATTLTQLKGSVTYAQVGGDIIGGATDSVFWNTTGLYGYTAGASFGEGGGVYTGVMGTFTVDIITNPFEAELARGAWDASAGLINTVAGINKQLTSHKKAVTAAKKCVTGSK